MEDVKADAVIPTQDANAEVPEEVSESILDDSEDAQDPEDPEDSEEKLVMSLSEEEKIGYFNDSNPYSNDFNDSCGEDRMKDF